MAKLIESDVNYCILCGTSLLVPDADGNDPSSYEWNNGHRFGYICERCHQRENRFKMKEQRELCKPIYRRAGY